MKSFLIIMVLVVCAASASAQLSDRVALDNTTRANSLGIAPVARVSSLIDLSRVRWSHSYSLAYSSGAYGGSAGLLNTTMFYDFSSSLSLAVNLGVLHNPGAVWGDAKNNTTLLPGFLLDYHPSDKFRLSIGMQTRYGGYNQLTR